MREHKYRAWFPKAKRMIHFEGVVFCDEYARMCLDIRDTDCTEEYQHLAGKSWIPNEEGLPLEYTGLLDKNGKEIYQGDMCKLDILGSALKYNPLAALLHVIDWRNASWGFRPLYPELVNEDDRKWKAFWNSEDEELWDSSYFEVIGNVYENPELIKEER